MVAAVLTGFAQVLLAAGRPKALFRFNVCVLVVYAGAVWFTAERGLKAVAIAVVSVYIAQLIAVYGILFRRVVGIPVGRMVSDLAPAVLGSAAALAVGFPLDSLLAKAGAPVPILVAIVAMAGLGAHVAILRAFFPSVWSDLWGFARRLLPARLQPRRWHPVPSTST
jgi:hypothetical protein